MVSFRFFQGARLRLLFVVRSVYFEVLFPVLRTQSMRAEVVADELTQTLSLSITLLLLKIPRIAPIVKTYC